MNDEFKKISNGNVTRYVLENASGGATSSGSVASVSMPMGGTRKRGDNLIAQEGDKKNIPASTPRNFVAKNAKSSGAGAHKDKKKAAKQGQEKHKKPFMESFNGEYDDEAGMAKTDLHTIARAAQGLIDTIDDKENLPEWAQEKLAKVEGMLVAVWDYLKSQEEQGIDPRIGEGDAGLSKDAETNFHAKLDQLVHATFGKRKEEQGVAEAFPNPGSGSTGNSKEDKRIAAALRKKHIPTTPNNKKEQGVAEGKPQKKADRYHINKDGKPATLASYPDKDSAVKDRDSKYPDAKVHQVGPRGKVKGEFEEGVAEGYTGRETKDGVWRVFKSGQAVAVAGPFKSREEASAWISKQKQGVAEGSEQVYNIVAVDKSNAMSKPTKLTFKAGSIEEVFDSLAANDWYPLEINGVEVINGKRLKQGVAEGVAETLPMNDAVKVLRQYGADHFKTTTNELHFYKNGRPMSVDLIFNDDATRSVNLSQLNSATRRLKGQGVAEGEKKTMSRAAKGNEKYGKDGMKALAKAGREGASEKKLDAIRDKHDNYNEEWSKKYKSSINCSHPKGFSQKAHCAGKKKHNESVEMESVCPDCGMCATHGDNMMEVKQRLDAKCWKGKHKAGTKMKGGIRVNNCVPNEGVAEGAKVDRQAKHITASMMKKGKSKKDAESIAWAHIKHPKNEGADPYFESLQHMMERQLEPTMDLDAWNDNFQNADPQKYHQFKNKSPEKKK